MMEVIDSVNKKKVVKKEILKFCAVFFICLLSPIFMQAAIIMEEGYKFIFLPFGIQLLMFLPLLILFSGGLYIFLMSKEARTDDLGHKLMRLPFFLTKLNMFVFIMLFSFWLAMKFFSYGT